MKTKHILHPFLVIFLCFFGWSCSSPAWEPSPITHPFLIGTEECRPPCWEGIIPGETSFDQALVLIEDLEFVNDKGLLRFSDEENYIHWFRGDSTNAEIIFSDNKLIYVRLDIDGGDLGSVTEHFGQPAGYTFGRDDQIYYIEAFFPNIGVVFIAGGDNSLISRTMRVGKVYFLYPADKEDFPAIYNYNRKLAHPRLRESDYYQWEGFGVNLSEKD